MNRKAQAAMEFLMTYGWAILVVIAAIAALAYFGVLSPDKMLPARTTFQAPVPTVDNAVITASDDSITLAFKNNVGFKINIDGVEGATGTDCGGVLVGQENISVSVDGAPFTQLNDTPRAEVKNGQGFRVMFHCTSDIEAGDKFTEDAISLVYTNNETAQQHRHLGSVTGRTA